MSHSLFDPPLLPEPFDAAREPIPARATDPETSVEAAKQHIASGKRQRNAELVLRLVQQFSGLTAVELHSRQTQLERHEVSRRLADLERRGFVRKGPARQCAVKGTRQVTWLISDRSL